MAHGPASVRVGTDLVQVDEVAASIRSFGDRYLGRLFTQREMDSTLGKNGLTPAKLAACFAAKEATIKVLQPRDAQPDWRSIEVRTTPDRSWGIHLSGTAARMAEEARIVDISLSLAPERETAAAVVVAICDVPPEER